MVSMMAGMSFGFGVCLFDERGEWDVWEEWELWEEWEEWEEWETKLAELAGEKLSRC